MVKKGGVQSLTALLSTLCTPQHPFPSVARPHLVLACPVIGIGTAYLDRGTLNFNTTLAEITGKNNLNAAKRLIVETAGLHNLVNTL